MIWYRSALGIGKNSHDSEVQIKKSLSVAESFKMISGYEELKGKVVQLAKELANKCFTENLLGRTLTMEYKTRNLICKQRSYTASMFIDTEDEMVNLSLKLFH